MARERGRREDDLAKFQAIEEEGRSRSSARDSLPKGDDAFLQRMEDAGNQMSQYFQKMKEQRFANFISRVGNTAYYNSTTVWKCETMGKTRAQCETPEAVKDRLRNVDEYAKEAIGKKCTWMLGDESFDNPDNPYTLNKFLNDLTACFHRGVEKYGTMAKEWHKEGKCMWRD